MLKINDEYYIDSDSMNYMLLKRMIAEKTGKERFDTLGYYGTLESLKSAFIERMIKLDLNLLNNIDEVIKIKKELKKVGDDK